MMAGNGKSRNITWNDITNQIRSYGWEIDGKKDRSLSFDSSGNITSITGDSYTEYTYDELNRLLSETTDKAVTDIEKRKHKIRLYRYSKL